MKTGSKKETRENRKDRINDNQPKRIKSKDIHKSSGQGKEKRSRGGGNRNICNGRNIENL